MALNPEDLLIFKVREEDKPEESKKEKKPVIQAVVPQPVPEPPYVEPTPVQKPQPQPRKPFFQRPKPQPVPEPKQEIVSEDHGEYYIAEPEYTASSADLVSDALRVAGVEKPKKNVKLKKEKDPRRIAQHMSCELHPWRRAYAICNYCKRAFCYEDVIESGGKYYCMDDIEKLPESARRSQIIRYNNLSLLSSVLFMLIFLVFFYYTYPQMIIVLGNLQKLGLSLFISDITNAEIFLLGEIILTVLSFMAALMILVSHPNSFRLSSVVGILTVALFSYQYIYVDKIYFVVISAMSFVALITLAYSRVSYESMPEEGEMPAIDVAKSSSF